MRRFSTLNESEIQKFSRIGSSWWDKNSHKGSKYLHAMNPCRLSFISRSLNNNLNGKVVLDVGCGGGILSEGLARLGAQVTAIDPSPENINIAQRHCRNDPATSSINYQCLNIEELSQRKETFDVICSLEVFLGWED